MATKKKRVSAQSSFRRWNSDESQWKMFAGDFTARQSSANGDEVASGAIRYADAMLAAIKSRFDANGRYSPSSSSAAARTLPLFDETSLGDIAATANGAEVVE